MAQLPSSKTPIDTLRTVALYHAQALTQEEVTRPLHATFLSSFEAWDGKVVAVERAERAQVAPLVAVRFAETRLEGVIGAIHHDATVEPGALAQLFPDGKQAETRARGESQAARTRNHLVPRLAAQPASSPLRAHIGTLDAALAAFEAALVARRAAAIAVGQARAEEQIARDDLTAHMRSNAGAITQLFPREASLRDRFFAEFRDSRHDASDPSDPTPAT